MGVLRLWFGASNVLAATPSKHRCILKTQQTACRVIVGNGCVKHFLGNVQNRIAKDAGVARINRYGKGPAKQGVLIL